MRLKRAVQTLGILFLGCRANTPQAPAPLPLDQPLATGQVRAGRIQKDTELIGGITAKGKLGDYKLYNNKVALIVGDVGRGVGYHPYGGTILDAAPIGVGSAFGEVIVGLDLSVLRAERIEVINDGRDGKEARLRVIGQPDVMLLLDALLSQLLEPAQLDMEWTVDYVLAPDAEHVRLEYNMFNRASTPVDFGLPLAAFLFGSGAEPFVPGRGFAVPSGGSSAEYYGALGEGVSYIYGQLDERISLLINQSGLVATGVGGGFELRARERKQIIHHLVIGDGALPKTQAIWRTLKGETEGTKVVGQVTDENGAPAAGARVHASVANTEREDLSYVSRAVTDAEGRYELQLSEGQYTVLAVSDSRTVSAAKTIQAQGELLQDVDLSLPVAGLVRYRITDAQDRLLPSKITIQPLDMAIEPLPGRFGEPAQRSGQQLPIFAHTGEGEVPLVAGRYALIVSRGMEYEIHRQEIELEPGGEVTLAATLARPVNTDGWMSTDTHVHALLSPDSPDSNHFKVQAMVVEGLELPVSTEHEHIGDFNPAISELGLNSWIQGIVGSEITTFVYGHFNAFPLTPDPSKPGNGRVDWYKKKPAETFAAIRENPAGPFIQVNHPRGAAIGGYFNAMGLDRETGIASREDQFSLDFDGIEVMNGCGAGNIERDTIQDWFGLLNKGHRKVGTASTDNHKAASGNMGYPVTFVRMPTDDPAEAQVSDFAKSFFEGRLVLSCGPFIEMKLGEAQVGDTVQPTDNTLALQVRVEAPSWVDVDRVEVVMGGEVVLTQAIEASEETVRFSGTLTATVSGKDTWVLVTASGDRHGPWAHGRPSFAMTNPIFVDVDGQGWSP